MKRHLISLISILTLTVLSVTFISAQVRPPLPRGSQKASVEQTLGTTDVSFTFSRPAVKGRTIWGDWPEAVAGETTLDNQNLRPKDAPIVPWGHIWRAGANEATLFVVADDVLINGKPLAAGKYSFHAIPAKDGEWTLIFNSDDGQWGSFSYDAKKDALRVKAKAFTTTDNQELLTYSIEPEGETSAIATLRWEKVAVPFKIEVKEVVGSTMKRLRTYVSDAKADEWQPPFNAANYAKANKLNEDAAKWYGQSLKAIDMQIAVKPTFANYRSKATILTNAGRMQEALAAAEKAVEIGKAEKTDAAQIAALEKRIADIKAGKQ
ncbi:MAG: DUF2911 domain-containing protein [Pyrinomonadaceae bacterium]